MAILFTTASLQRIDLGLDLPLLNGAAGGTLMGWIRTTRISGADQRIISIAIGPPPGTTNSSRLGLILITGGIVAAIGRDADGASPTTVSSPVSQYAAGVWTHVGCTYDCPTRLASLYVNGVLVGSGTFTNSSGANYSSTNSKNASIGASTNGIDSFMDGDIEDARVYRRVLSEAEFMTIFSTMGKDGIVNGLEGRWHMREQGEGIGVGSVIDSSNSGIGGLPSATPPTYSGSSISSPRSRRPWSG